MRRGNGTMCVSKDLDEWTGNYICEVGAGIKEEQGRARGKKRWRKSSRIRVFKLSQKKVWISGRYVNKENYKLPPLCFCFVLKILMSFSELRSLNQVLPDFHDPKHIRCSALQAGEAKPTLVQQQLLWSHMKLLRIKTNSMCLNPILAGKPAASTTMRRDELHME